MCLCHMFYIYSTFQDAQLNVLGECGPVEEAVTAVRHHLGDTTKPFPDPDKVPCHLEPRNGDNCMNNVEEASAGLRIRPSPLTLDQRGCVMQPDQNSLLLSPTLATGPAALSFAATRPVLASSQLSLDSTASSAFGFIVGAIEQVNSNGTVGGSVTTLHQQNNNNSTASGFPQPPPMLPSYLNSSVVSPGVCYIFLFESFPFRLMVH